MKPILLNALRCTDSQVCITDPDLIEKSNLNRQFLFRPHHIQVNTISVFPLTLEPFVMQLVQVHSCTNKNNTFTNSAMMPLQKPKSTTAAEATGEINSDLQVEAHLNKVCPATESIYSDTFYSRSNVVITALDNVEARRYVDRSVVSRYVKVDYRFSGV